MVQEKKRSNLPYHNFLSPSAFHSPHPSYNSSVSAAPRTSSHRSIPFRRRNRDWRMRDSNAKRAAHRHDYRRHHRHTCRPSHNNPLRPHYRYRRPASGATTKYFHCTLYTHKICLYPSHTHRYCTGFFSLHRLSLCLLQNHSLLLYLYDRLLIRRGGILYPKYYFHRLFRN